MGIFSLTTLSTMAEKAVKPYWQDVQVVEVNKEYPRTSFMTYNNRADALSGKFERSKYYRLLNGTWKFYFVDSYRTPIQIRGMIFRCPATGKYKDTE